MASKRAASDDGVTNSDKTAAKVSRYQGSFQYKEKFKSQWIETYPEIKAFPPDVYTVYCLSSAKSASCHHQGFGDVKSHCITPSIIRIYGLGVRNASLDKQVKLTNSLVQQS